VAQNEAGFQAQSAATFEHAMRVGPRLQSEPGTPEFVASYNAAVATKIAAPEGQLLRLLQEYQRSQDFLGLRDKTRSDYIAHIKKIEVKFGDMPTKALADPSARACLWDRRDELALESLRGADYTWTVLAAVLAWAKDRGKIPVNPCERGGRLYRGPPGSGRTLDIGPSRLSRLSEIPPCPSTGAGLQIGSLE
jgi:hypothetical protein